MITLNQKTRFTHSDFSYSIVTYTEYLYGSIGLKVNAEIIIDIHWSTLDVNMTFNSADNTMTRNDGGTNSFITDGFRVGDSVIIADTASNNGGKTIESLTDSVMTFTTAVIDETINSNVYGNPNLTAIDFYPNLIPNGIQFDLMNLTDRETAPRYSADTISTDSSNPTIMTVTTNSHGWVTPGDRATIYQYPTIFTPYTQRMVINHTFNISPIYIANQLENLKRGIPPAAGVFRDRSCLKYVFTIDAKNTPYDPTITHTTDGNVEFPNGQTGWFNEFINGRPTVWTKQSILYSDNATGAGLTAIDYGKVVNVDARIQCQVAAGSKYIVQIMYLPINEDQYVDTPTDYKTNFVYERAVVSIGGGTVQGENTGDYHFLKNVVATALDTNSTKITFQTEFSSVLQAKFNCLDSDNLNYLIFITAQNSGIPLP